MAEDFNLQHTLSGLTGSDSAAARAAFEAGSQTIVTIELLEPPPPPTTRKHAKRNKHNERRTLRTKETGLLTERFWAAALYLGVHRHFNQTASSFAQRAPAGDSTLKGKLRHICRLLEYWGDDFWAKLTQRGIVLPFEPSKNFIDQLVVIASEQSLPEFANSLLEFLPTFSTRYHKKTRALQDGSSAITVTVLKQYREWKSRPHLVVRLPIQVSSALLERTPASSAISIERARRMSVATSDQCSTPTRSPQHTHAASILPSSPLDSPDERSNGLDFLSDHGNDYGDQSSDLEHFTGPDFSQDDYNTFDPVDEIQATFEMQAVIGTDRGRTPTSQSAQGSRTERSATPESLRTTQSDDTSNIGVDIVSRLGAEGIDLLKIYLHASAPLDKRVEDARSIARKAWFAADQARLTLRAARDDARGMFYNDRRPEKQEVVEKLSKTKTKLQTTNELNAALATLRDAEHDLLNHDKLEALHVDYEDKVDKLENTREACEDLLSKFHGVEEARKERQRVYSKYHEVKKWADSVHDAVQRMRGKGSKRKFSEMLGRAREHGGEGSLRFDSEETGTG